MPISSGALGWPNSYFHKPEKADRTFGRTIYPSEDWKRRRESGNKWGKETDAEAVQDESGSKWKKKHGKKTKKKKQGSTRVILVEECITTVATANIITRTATFLGFIGGNSTVVSTTRHQHTENKHCSNQSQSDADAASANDNGNDDDKDDEKKNKRRRKCCLIFCIMMLLLMLLLALLLGLLFGLSGTEEETGPLVEDSLSCDGEWKIHFLAYYPEDNTTQDLFCCYNVSTRAWNRTRQSTEYPDSHVINETECMNTGATCKEMFSEEECTSLACYCRKYHTSLWILSIFTYAILSA